ncbi:uncharacterized protein MKK02DRAFT_12053, partial [Dioszegia hungarica]
KGKGKEVAEPAKKKAKKGVEAADEKTEEVKGAAKKGKKAAGDKAEEVKETATKKGKKASAAAEDKAEEVKETATKKGKKATEAAGDKAEEPVVTKGKEVVAAAVGATTAAAKKGTKIAKAAAAAAVEAAQEDEEMPSDDEEAHGYSSSDGEADSSDDESDGEDVAVREAGRKIDMKGLPMVAKDDKSVAARLKKANKKKDDAKGTLYLGRIPHGFYEDEMKEYFGQFGEVSRLRLARNRQTGASKHYAYIEMSSGSVAQIVAETMNNYLLMGHLLKCHVLPADDIHPELWAGANKKFRVIPRARLEKARQDKPRTQEQKDKSNQNVLKKQESRKKKIQEKGIDYEFE